MGLENTSLIHYQRTDGKPVDTSEKLGKTLTYFLTALAGKTYKVQNATFTEQPTLSKVRKVFLAIIFALLAPITISMSLLGMLFTHLSKSHQFTIKAHLKFQHDQSPERELQRIGEITKDILSCVHCKQITINPKVIAKCKHIICNSCEVNKVIQFCPVSKCNTPIISTFTLPVVTRLAKSILNHQESSVSIEQYKNEALNLACFSQAELGNATALEIISKIDPQELKNGIYFQFEQRTTTLFFHTFFVSLAGRHVKGLPDGATLGCWIGQNKLAVQAKDQQNNYYPSSGKRQTIYVNNTGMWSFNNPNIPQPPAAAPPPPVAAVPAPKQAVPTPASPTLT